MQANCAAPQIDVAFRASRRRDRYPQRNPERTLDSGIAQMNGDA
jgi:hypothetical protein